nr:MAG TPA: Nuclease [Caudoviricetes sp.]
MKEAVFSRSVTKYLESVGAIVNNQTGSMFSKVGVSDLLICYKGIFIALELKVGNYQPDPLQIVYLQKVRESGGIGLLLRDTLEDLETVIYMIDNNVLMQYNQPELPKIELEEIEYD